MDPSCGTSNYPQNTSTPSFSKTRLEEVGSVPSFPIYISDHCPTTNRGCDSNQAVTIVCPAIYRLFMSFVILYINLPEGCIVTTKYIASGQVSRVRGRITPNFGCPISASSDHFPGLCGVMLRPCYNFVVYLWGRIRFEGFGLHHEKFSWMRPACMEVNCSHQECPRPKWHHFHLLQRRLPLHAQSRRDIGMKCGRGRKSH